MGWMWGGRLERGVLVVVRKHRRKRERESGGWKRNGGKYRSHDLGDR